MKTKSLALSILAISMWVSACHKKPVGPLATPPPVLQPVPVSPPPVPVPATWPELPLPPSRLPAPPEPPLPRSFRDGEASFQSGKYAEAIRFYERYLREDPVIQYKDVAMFRLGILYTLSCSSPECRAKSLEKSEEQFKRLVSQFPRSPYSAEARFILSLQTEIEKMKTEAKTREEKIKKLTDELDRLKKIDLERQPSRIKK
ncbi:MAG: outer membrane protein assembly factor BamD [Acidobacteriia bacterium]|nr:outer membrane protein assembly factor BamD [Terriglobia bacterium]